MFLQILMAFSVLMANYNNGKYIKKAIESVLNQTYSKWELIIVDDASTDNSLEIIKPYLRNKRIKLIKHKKNLGCGATKKTCARNANGELLGVLDSDDVLHKDAVKIMVKTHQDNPDCGLIYSTFYVCDNNLKIKNIFEKVGKIGKGKTTQQSNKVISHFATFKRSAYDKTGGFDLKQRKAADKDIYLKLEEVTKLKFINKPLYYYRRNEKGISQDKNMKKARAYYTLARYKAYKRRLHTNIANLTKKRITDLLLKAGEIYIEEKNFKKARYFFFEAIKLNPLKLNYMKTCIKRIILKI